MYRKILLITIFFIIVSFTGCQIETNKSNESPGENSKKPHIMVNDNLYSISGFYTDYKSMMDIITKLGVLESIVKSTEMPQENFSSNYGNVGTEIYYVEVRGLNSIYLKVKRSDGNLYLVKYDLVNYDSSTFHDKIYLRS